MTPKQIRNQRIRDLRATGLTLDKIAEQLRISRSTVRRQLDLEKFLAYERRYREAHRDAYTAYHRDYRELARADRNQYFVERRLALKGAA